jgi:hypothetical protein
MLQSCLVKFKLLILPQLLQLLVHFVTEFALNQIGLLICSLLMQVKSEGVLGLLELHFFLQTHQSLPAVV